KTLKGIAWFRTTFVIDSTIDDVPLSLKLRTNGACDVFIDGKLIHSLGVVGKNEIEQVSGFSLRASNIPVPMCNAGRHLIAIRSSNYNKSGKIGFINIKPSLDMSGVDAELVSMQKALDD